MSTPKAVDPMDRSIRLGMAEWARLAELTPGVSRSWSDRVRALIALAEDTTRIARFVACEADLASHSTQCDDFCPCMCGLAEVESWAATYAGTPNA